MGSIAQSLRHQRCLQRPCLRWGTQTFPPGRLRKSAREFRQSLWHRRGLDSRCRAGSVRNRPGWPKPMLEVIVPIRAADGTPETYAKFLLDASGLKAEYESLDATLRRQSRLAFSWREDNDRGTGVCLSPTGGDPATAHPRQSGADACCQDGGGGCSDLAPHPWIEESLAGLRQFVSTGARGPSPDSGVEWSEAADSTRRMQAMIDAVTGVLREDSGLIPVRDQPAGTARYSGAPEASLSRETRFGGVLCEGRAADSQSGCQRVPAHSGKPRPKCRAGVTLRQGGANSGDGDSGIPGFRVRTTAVDCRNPSESVYSPRGDGKGGQDRIGAGSEPAIGEESRRHFGVGGDPDPKGRSLFSAGIAGRGGPRFPANPDPDNRIDRWVRPATAMGTPAAKGPGFRPRWTASSGVGPVHREFKDVEVAGSPWARDR